MLQLWHNNVTGDVIMSELRPIKDLRNTIKLYQKLAEAEVQVKNGEVLLDGEEVFKDLKKKYGKK